MKGKSLPVMSSIKVIAAATVAVVLFCALDVLLHTIASAKMASAAPASRVSGRGSGLQSFGQNVPNVQYTVTDLGGIQWRYGSPGMNNKGEVVWGSATAPLYYHGGSITPIPVPGGYDGYSANEITDQGTIIGRAVSAAKADQSVMLEGTSRGLLPVSLPAGINGRDVYVENGKGQMAGALQVSGSTWSLFLLDKGKVAAQFTVPNCLYLHPNALNNNGDIAGYGQLISDTQEKAFLWSGGRFTLIMAPNSDGCAAGAISDSGYVSCYAPLQTGSSVGWLYHASAFTRLEPPPGSVNCGVTAFNNTGGAIGTIYTGKQNPHDAVVAAVFQGHKAIDLNTLIASGSGLLLNQPLRINDRGQILCSADKNGQDVLVLLSPKQ